MAVPHDAQTIGNKTPQVKLEERPRGQGDIPAGDADNYPYMGANESVEHRAEPGIIPASAAMIPRSEQPKTAAPDPVSKAPAHPPEKSSEQTEKPAPTIKPKLSLVGRPEMSRSLVSKEAPAMKINNLAESLTSEQTPLRTSEQKKKSSGQKVKKASERPKTAAPAHPPEKPEEWLKSILPTADGGWWEVRSEGKGYSVKFRWRSTETTTALTFPRVSADQYRLLRKEGENEARRIFTGRILGHLEDLTYEPGREPKARNVAARLGFDLENDKAVGF